MRGIATALVLGIISFVSGPRDCVARQVGSSTAPKPVTKEVWGTISRSMGIRAEISLRMSDGLWVGDRVEFYRRDSQGTRRHAGWLTIESVAAERTVAKGDFVIPTYGDVLFRRTLPSSDPTSPVNAMVGAAGVFSLLGTDTDYTGVILDVRLSSNGRINEVTAVFGSGSSQVKRVYPASNIIRLNVNGLRYLHQFDNQTLVDEKTIARVAANPAGSDVMPGAPGFGNDLNERKAATKPVAPKTETAKVPRKKGTRTFIVLDPETGKYVPEPGFAWVENPGSPDGRVDWKPGVKHPRFPHVIAGTAFQTWEAEAGYVLTPRGPGDLTVTPLGLIQDDFWNLFEMPGVAPSNAPKKTPSPAKGPSWGQKLAAVGVVVGGLVAASLLGKELGASNDAHRASLGKSCDKCEGRNAYCSLCNGTGIIGGCRQCNAQRPRKFCERCQSTGLLD